jgi:acyl-CoA:acyl-CoA alkyltransferase
VTTRPPAPTAPPYSTISSVAVHIPSHRQTGTEIEDGVRARNPGIHLMPGLLEQMYGFRERRVAPAGTYPSDLAAAAGRRALDQARIGPGDIDLLIFASTGEDVEEPATAHIVAHKLGIAAPAFDVQNACNGVVNAIDIADALIRTRRHTRVLIATGELNTRYSRLPIRDRTELAGMLPALTLGDMGAALIVEANNRPGLLGCRFWANSSAWRAAIIANPYLSPESGALAVRFDSQALAASFTGMATLATKTLESWGADAEGIDLACVHQASVPFTRLILDSLGIPRSKAVSTFPRYGNVATATLPLQLVEAAEQGLLHAGSRVALLGLASGASVGLLLMEWRPVASPAGRPPEQRQPHHTPDRTSPITTARELIP